MSEGFELCEKFETNLLLLRLNPTTTRCWKDVVCYVDNDVNTLKRKPYNVVLTSCTGWERLSCTSAHSLESF